MSTTNSGAGDRSYRRDIDGMRAIAILSVVLYHAGVPLLTGGFTGVDIFFVISGYLIGGHILFELNAGSFSYLRFYQRRAKRILPALYAVLAVSMLLSMFLLAPLEAARAARDIFAATLSVSNILFWRTAGYFAPSHFLNPILMTWSLGVEEQFYAVIPLVLVLLTRFRRKLILTALIVVSGLSFFFSWRVLRISQGIAFYWLLARAWELGAGVILAGAELRWKRVTSSAFLAQLSSFVGLVLIVAPMFLLSDSTLFPGPAALPSVLGATLVLATSGSRINSRLLSLPALTFIGRVSYSWYLWHWPILAFVHIIGGEHVRRAMAVWAVGVAFAIAVVSYFFIEQPFRRSSRAPVPLLVRYAIVSAAILAVSGFVWGKHGFPERFPVLNQMEVSGLALATDPCIVARLDTPNLASACYDSTTRKRSIALWGDSHSSQLAPGFRSLASGRGYAVVEFGKNSCLPLIGAAHFIPSNPLGGRDCLHFNLKVLDLLRADPNIRIVVIAGAWGHTFGETRELGWLAAGPFDDNQVPTIEAQRTLFVNAIMATILSLQAAGKQVIVFQDTPHFDFDPRWRVQTSKIPFRRDIANWMGMPNPIDPGFAPPADTPADRLPREALVQTIPSLPSTSLVDLRPELCRETTECEYRSGDRLLYEDNNHLTPDGARYALRDFRLLP